MGRYGSVLLRLEALEGLTGLATAMPAPNFSLPDLAGGVVELQNALTEDRPVQVVFISPSCSLCSELLPDLQSWQSDAAHPASVLVISSGGVDANLEKLGSNRVRVALQNDWEIADLYGVQGTPASFLVATDGSLAGPAAHGVDEVRAQHDRLVESVTNTASPSAALHTIGRRPASPGDPVPDVALASEAGVATTAAALSEGPGAMILFWRTTCGYCADIVAELGSLETSAPVILITASDVVDVRASGLTSPVYREDAYQLTLALQVPGTPSAVWVHNGSLASSVAVGGPDVLALLREVSSSSAGRVAVRQSVQEVR